MVAITAMAAPQQRTAVGGLDRGDPRLDRTLVGGVLFLASELMFFTGLFAAWFMLRAQTPVWPPAGVEPEPWIALAATAVLVAAAVPAHLVARGARERLLLLGAAGALVFCALTVWGWARAGLGIGDHAYASLYYALTGLHLVHVVAGVAVVAAVAVRASSTGARTSADVLGVVAWFTWWLAAVAVAVFCLIYLVG